MTRDEGVALIQEQLGFRTTLSSSIVTNMKLAQQTLEQGPTKPWFLITEDAYVRTTAEDERLPLPDDFIEEVDEAVLRYVPDAVSQDDPEVDLDKDEYDVLRKNYKDVNTGTTKTGAPEAYALVGNYFRIFPTPDDDYLIHMIYYGEDDTLDTNIENKWLKYCPYLLLGKAGKQISFGPLRDQAAWQVFDSWEKEGRAILISKNTARAMSNMQMQIGGPH